MSISTIRRALWLGLILFMAIGNAAFADECAPGIAESIDNAGNVVVYYGVNYDDPVVGQSTWFYCVRSQNKNFLSEIIFWGCIDLVGGGTWGPSKADRIENQEVDILKGGVKFESDWLTGEVRYIYYTVEGNANDGEVPYRTRGPKFKGEDVTTGPLVDCPACSGKVLGNVYADANKNGVFEIGETGIDGVTVGLFEVGGGIPIKLDTTTDGGVFSFLDLPGSEYELDVDESVLQAMTPPLFSTTPDDGNSALAPVCTSTDFGYAGTNGALGDFVWMDDVNPGVQDVGERGIQKVKLTITDGPSDVGSSRLTDYFGWYFFKGLSAGEYTVEVDPETALLANVTVPTEQVTTEDIPLGKFASDLESTSPLTITKTVSDGFLNSGFDFGFSAIVLPIELSSFSALAFEDRVTLTWTTASESDNAGFALETLRNGQFEEVGFVHGAGTTTERSDYEFTVAGLVSGKHSFRLRQIDFDGSQSLSDVIEVIIDAPGALHVASVFPNPFNQTASFDVGVRRSQEVRITLHDALGREVQTILEGRIRDDAPTSVTLDGSQLPSGHYVVLVRGKDFETARSVVLLR